MKRLYPLLLLSLLFIGCSDKHDDQPNSPAVQLYELHYTTIDEKVVEPYRDDFGADIVSNTYNDGVGVIAFDAPITTIGERVFYNCSTLESITIPSSVTAIGSEAFYRCDCLKAFKGKYATPDGRALIIDETLCYIAPSGLTDYTIPSDVKTLGSLSFAYCTELVTVKIPSSVTAIGSEAFYACTSIEGVTLPESVVSLGALSFAECDHLSEVYVQQSTPPTGGDDMFDGNAANRKIYVPIGSGSTYKMANGWKEYSTSIEEYDFNPVPDVVIKEATVAEFIAAEVGDATIYELTGVIQNIQNVEYGNFDLVDATGSVYIYGLTDESGEKVFEALGLKEGDTVTLRGTRSAYKDTPEVIGAIYVSHVACPVPSEQTNYEIWYTSSDGKVVEPYRSEAFDANIISNIYENGNGVITFDGEVTTIDNYAFYGCRLLTSVTLPSSVTTLGFQIFYDCDGITSITIPESVTTIEGGAFTGCDNLSEFKGKYATKDGHCLIIGNTLHSFVSVGVDTYVVPAGVTRIEDYAFYDTAISDVTFPDGLTYIGVSTFAYCSDIKALTLPSSITHISSAAFCQCSSLTSITIPEYVEFIGDRAFLSCESLLEIYSKPTIPPTGDDYMFEGNSADRKIYVPVQSYSAYVSKEHWLDYADYIVGYDFEKGEVAPEGPRNNEIWYTSSGGNIVTPHRSNVFGATIVSNTYEDGKGVITFDGAVTTIGDYAFYECYSLTSVSIPDSVTTIGKKAFYDCDSLTSISIPDSVTTIGDYAFYYCNSLTSVTIPDGVTTIGERAFYSCYSLTSVTIPDSVTTIGDYAFYSCNSLTSVTIPDSVTTIGDSAFYSCNSLTSVTIPDSVTTIGDSAFYYCNSLTSVTIGDSVTTIGDEAFGWCENLTSVTIPDSVTTIGEEAFYSCGSLTSVTIGDSVTTIGGWAFHSCSSLTSVTIPDSVTKIGDCAFYDCSSLTSVTIPDSVTKIGGSAFSDCDSLTSVTIPDSVTTIGGSAFSGCYSLTSVYCKATTPPSIGGDVFYDNADNRKIYVPTASVNDYKSAFGWRNYANYIVGYDFAKGEVAVDDPVLILTSEAEMRFLSNGGNGEISYIIDNPVESLSVIVSCDAQWITNFVVSSNKVKFTVAANDRSALRTASITVKYGVLSFTVDVTQDAKAGQAYNEIWYTSSDGNIVTPYRSNVFGTTIVSNTYKDGKGVITFDGAVTTIGESAFLNCDSLTSITIPDSVTTIGNSAFSGCYSLTSVTIPDSVNTIGERAFYSCGSLTSITIPDSVTTIGDSAFEGCDSLTSVTIPDSVTTIGVGAFAFCHSLKEFKGKYATDNGRCLIKDNTIIAYAEASGTEYTIPDSVTTIGGYTFYDCYSLTSITIPDSVTTIGDDAFYYCDSLTSVTIPDSVTTIGDRAFYSCRSLTSVYCKATTPPSIGYGVFYDNANSRKIYVPVASVDAYKTAEGWSYYADDIVAYDFEKGEVAVDDPVLILTSEAEMSFLSYGGNGEISYIINNPVESLSVIVSCDAQWITNFVVSSNKIKFTVAANDRSALRTASITVRYGVLSFMVDVTQDAKAGQTYNEIWYTSTDGNIVTPFTSNVFGATIVSNTYEDGKGVITFDGAVTTIGDEAFHSCDSLTSITIPDSVTTIGYKAFYSCDSLTSVTIPDSVTTIGERAFYSCGSLTSITIPDSVTTIGDSAFEGCDSLTSVTIPDSVTTIGNSAFWSCEGLTSVTIPDSVTTIGDDAFRYCSSLTSVAIGDSVTTIGIRAFAFCNSLKEFKGKYATDNGRSLIKDNTIIAYAEASGTEYTIPDSVTTIGGYAFFNCNGLTSVTIGDSVTTIGDYAFDDCDSLTSVTIGESVTTIGNYAFYGCDSLTSVTIPDSVTTIGAEAFSYCDSLTSVTIGDSVTTIGKSAFHGCRSLTSVTIGDSVTTIGNRAFAACDSLKEFKGKYATDNGRCLIVDNTLIAYANKSGTEYTIPGSVTTIGEYAFYCCTLLESVTIGDSVTTIGGYAFYKCKSLTSVYCKATTSPSIGYGVFSVNANSRKIYVPTASVNGYKSAYRWSDYADYIVGYDF